MAEWIDYELPLETAVHMEQHLRHIDVLPADELRELTKDLCKNWHGQKHILKQAIMRVAQLENQLMQRQIAPSDHQTSPAKSVDPHPT